MSRVPATDNNAGGVILNYPVRGREFGSRFKGRAIAHLASRREAVDDGKKGGEEGGGGRGEELR